MLELRCPPGYSLIWRDAPPQWILREGETGRKTVEVVPVPFAIGRALDCQLVLPESVELASTTSRWHCYIGGQDGKRTVTDGSLKPLPETGKPKPSVSGTYLNGKRISAPKELDSGDALVIGPWKFTVEVKKRDTVDIDRLFSKISHQGPMEIPRDDSRVHEAYGYLPGLFDKLNDSDDPESCLMAVLNYALEKIPAAQVAAILTEGPAGETAVRMAVKRDQGRIHELNVSQGLLKSLKSDGSYLLESAQGDPTKSQIEIKISSGLIVPLRGHRSRLGLLYMDNRDRGVSFTERDFYLSHALSGVAGLHLLLEKQAFLQRTEQNMAKYFGPEVVKHILEESSQGRAVSLGVKECEASILFVDMVQFSDSCRGRGPQEIADLLSPYYRLMSECIQRYGGHVDKFIGDAVLGVFGAQPLSHKATQRTDHAVQAVRAAREMITSWGWSAPEGWGAHVALRVGINTGKVVAGNIGFTGRMEYSVIGDSVNLASHLQRHAKPDTLVLTDSTKKLLGDEFSCTDSGQIEVKGFGRVQTWLVA